MAGEADLTIRFAGFSTMSGAPQRLGRKPDGAVSNRLILCVQPLGRPITALSLTEPRGVAVRAAHHYPERRPQLLDLGSCAHCVLAGYRRLSRRILKRFTQAGGVVWMQFAFARIAVAVQGGQSSKNNIKHSGSPSQRVGRAWCLPIKKTDKSLNLFFLVYAEHSVS
jgi:hypothetical protein